MIAFCALASLVKIEGSSCDRGAAIRTEASSAPAGVRGGEQGISRRFIAGDSVREDRSMRPCSIQNVQVNFALASSLTA